MLHGEQRRDDLFAITDFTVFDIEDAPVQINTEYYILCIIVGDLIQFKVL